MCFREGPDNWQIGFASISGLLLWSGGILLNALVSQVYLYEGLNDLTDRESIFEVGLIERLISSQLLYMPDMAEALIFDTNFGEPFALLSATSIQIVDLIHTTQERGVTIP